MGLIYIQRNVTTLLVVFFCYFSAQAQKKILRPHPSSDLSFVKNMGQWQAPFLFKATVPNGAIFLEKSGITYNFVEDESRHQLHNLMHRHFVDSSNMPFSIKLHALKMQFKNCNSELKIKEEEMLATYHNYYLGSDPRIWQNRVPLFNKIVYHEVYNGIDYEVFTAGRSFKYNFIVNPNADYNQIVMQYDQGLLSLDDGKLRIKTEVNEMLEAAPYAYQIINGANIKIQCSFALNGNEVSFRVGEFNQNYTLIIDPTIIFATYSGSTVDNFGFTASFDSEEHLFCAGICESIGYPVSSGAFQSTFQGGSARNIFKGVDNPPIGWDISISKYDSSGAKVLYATYLGGKENEYPHSLLVDNSDNLVVLGSTFSNNFPHTSNAFDTVLNRNGDTISTDMFITRFDGAGKLVASTFIGGDDYDGNNMGGSLQYNYADEFRGDIINDNNNNYYIGSVTASANFPMKNALQGTKKNGHDGVVFKIDSTLSNLYWSTFLGGDADDAIYSIDLDKSLNVYVAGGTMSNNFPTTSGAYQKNKTASGDADGVIAKFSNNGQLLIGSTYVGTSGYDQVYFLEIDKDGNIFATGQTEGAFPVSSGLYSKSNGSQFIIKLDGDLRTYILSTTFGSGRLNSSGRPNPDISPTAFLVDNCDLIYVCGWGSNLGMNHLGSTKDMLVSSTTPPLYTTTDNNDFYIIVFNKDCQNVKFNTYFGENGDVDHVDGGTNRFDKRGIIYASVCASCYATGSGFPTQPPGVAYPSNLSPRCSNASFKIDFQLQTSIIAAFRPSPRIACVPQMVTMNNKSNASHVFWDFGDGTTDTVYDPKHLYLKAGNYKIRLICEDTSTCNHYDTIYDEINLYDQAVADFSYEISYCESSVTLKKQSKNQINFLWDFGDGKMDSTTDNPKHIYAQSGKYNLTLYINNGLNCSDSITKTIDFDKYKPTSPIIPNVFTPNGDGQNDVFEIGGVNPKCDSIEIKVYNRWGLLVFESKEIGNWWTGKDRNKLFPDGIYYFTLKVTDYKGNISQRKGDITLVR